MDPRITQEGGVPAAVQIPASSSSTSFDAVAGPLFGHEAEGAQPQVLAQARACAAPQVHALRREEDIEHHAMKRRARLLSVREAQTCKDARRFADLQV